MDPHVIKDLTKEIKKQNRYLHTHNVVVRSFITGIFTALGATVGFAVMIIVAAGFVNAFGGIPIVASILKETKLDKIIEYQLQQIEKNLNDGDPNNGEEPQPDGSGSETGSGAQTGSGSSLN